MRIKLKIEERTENVNLFNGLENLTLLHISDIHLWYSKEILRILKNAIIRINPDLIVLTGDYYDVPRGAYNFRDFLYKLSLEYTIVFIRGNHDFIYGSKISNLIVGMNNCYCVEDSVYTFTSKKGHSYNFTSWQSRFKLMDVKKGKNILLIHNPEKLIEKELTDIDLILAGHLHGGQFIFFKTPSQSFFPGNLFYKYCTDKKQILNTTLIVSRGLGDTLPFRLNCPKEIVKININ